MKWFRKRPVIAALSIAGFVVAARGELSQWVENITAGSPLDSVFFKTVTVGTSTVPARRPPAETRPELTKLIGASPNDASLYSLRALEAEQQLDFRAAESDWTKHAQLAADKFSSQIALADFYHRRVEPAKELTALHAAAVVPTGPTERFRPAAEQQSWKTFERAITLIDEQLLGFDAARTEFRAWIEHYPKEPGAYVRFVDYAVAHKQFNDAEQTAQQYATAFPNDPVQPMRARAQIEAARGSTQAALALYDKSFRALWPPELVKSYFELLSKTGSLRRYLQEARRGTTVDSAARIFYYWQQQGDIGRGQHALVEFESRKDAQKSAWTADELSTLAQLYEAANSPDRAARCYYALYSLPGGDAERALAGIANLLFAQAGQGIHFGAADLSYYRDIAQADPYPGYLNGVLSLILNTTEPTWKYSEENQNAQPYFHRARGSELLALFDSRFPNSARRPGLHAQRINAYAIHGDNQAVIQAGSRFRTQFPNAEARTQVATLMADAYARTNQTPAEFALYDELLQELGRRADGVPLGERAGVPTTPPKNQQNNAEKAPELHPRSPEYARILDRYIARLVGLKRIPDALALYRRELDRNASDPGLYERFAAFLEQNRLGAEVEATYKRALAQFQDTGWTHKLARWYLRQKQTTQLGALTRDVTTKFSGTDLEAYFRAAVPRGSVGPALYLQLNLYAHQRFPHNLTFTRNLMTAYTTRGTVDALAYDALLRANWFYADDLRMRFFEYLSRTKKLEAELAALGAINTPQQVNTNPAAARMLADGESWRAHYETAAPVYRAIATSYPAASPTPERAAALYRSLATLDPKQTEVAAGIEQNLVSYSPGSSPALTYEGEIYADRERFDKARPLWNRIATAAPGRTDGYLESATVFWDYFLFDDALRVINEGRRKLNDASLFSYQAGAIYENKRQYDRALTEYANAALEQSSDIAQRRLVRLARRPALRANVEKLTADIANRPDPTARAIALRTAVLENQGRRADLEQFLIAAGGRTSSMDTLDAVENQGRISGFAKVQETAMQRRVSITTDPIDQTRYQLALAHFYEDQGRIADAQKQFADLYQAHPTTLGVVRAATDFYWRSNQQKRSVETLTAAANRAQPTYQRAFRLEAARKATESGDTVAARQVLALLLKEDPYRAEYLAAMADTYARANDDRGLRAFYQTTIDSLRGSNLTAPEKTERTAAMRRGLIPVLTRVQDYAGALDQYIEILNRYPEDEQLARETAAYAGAHSLQDKLIGYYTKTAAGSPKDYRWAMVLARVDKELERFPEAIEAYGKATAIRPDRTDLWIAQAELDERLLRFADAERNYARLFELTYRNAAWMERVATVRARQGNKDGVIAALRTAYIENRPERADNYLAVATKLDSWGYVEEARQFAEKAADSDSSGYVHVLARARQYEPLFAKFAENPGALQELGTVARDYYTPEEKTTFAAFLEKQRKPNSQAELGIATAAGLEDVGVRWLATLVRAQPGDIGWQNQLIERQRARMRFAELGGQLEAVWKAAPPQTENRDSLLVRAAEAYAQAGDAAAELRVIRLKKTQSGLEGPLAQRFCRLLIQQPQALVTVAGTDPAEDMRDMAANCAVANGRPADALSAIAARGKGLPPVWTSAYTGITGLFFGVTTPQIRDAFVAALGSPLIGDRVGKPGDPERQLAGAPWFYYGSRYGEYLTISKQPNAADYVPAMVEASPGNARAYFELGDYYRDAGDAQHALVEYGHSLELDPDDGAAHDRMAELQWAAGRHDDAVAQWRLALEALDADQNRGSAPPTFWEDLKNTLTHIGQHDVLAPVRTEADRLLKTYLRRNGTYQFEPILDGILAAAGDAAKGVAWLEELSRSAGDPMGVLAWAVRHQSVPDAQRDALYQKLIDAEQAKLAGAFGQPRESAENSLRSWQLEYLRSLIARNQTQRARALLNSIPESARKSRLNEIVLLDLQIAAQANAVPATLARYGGLREGPPLDALGTAANELRRTGYDPAARRVLEFVYLRELEAHKFDAATFLGLAEIRLEENQAPAALELLKRMTMLSGEPFETLAPAAALLERFQKSSEAATFYDQRVKAAPWDTAARERLAELRKNTQDLTAIASDKFAPYSVRTDAAAALRTNGGATLTTGAAELDLLASSGALTEQAVNKPYWYRSRIEAAAGTKDAAVKIRILQAAIATVPAPPEPRLQLFRAAIDQKRWALAISAVPNLPDGSDSIPDGERFPEWVTSAFLQGTTVSVTDRAFLARGLGESYQRLNDPARAVFYYRLSLELDKSAAQRTAIEPVLQTLRQSLSLKGTNEARRPVVNKNLEQPHVVRPRLTTLARGGAR